MEVCSAAPVKEKRKNSEKRKEKSRDAARCRRSKESEYFSMLGAALPLPASVVSHLDKASIMRLIITDLRLIKVFKSLGLKDATDEDTKKYDSFYLKAAGGFVLVLSLDGDIVFVSQNVSHHLGITQVDVLGQNMSDLSHPCDHAEISDIFAGKIGKDKQRSFFMRMKCLATKGRGINTKSTSYKVLHIVGRFVKMGDDPADGHSFIAIATPIPHPNDIEMPLGEKSTFLSKHSLDMKFTYADDKMEGFLGYNPESLLGKSVYDFHHALDNKTIEKAFRGLFSKGQSETGQYRFLTQGGGYIWVSTQATVIYGEKNSRPQSVVCINYVVSEKCEASSIYSCEQLEYVNKKRPVSSTKSLFVSIKSELPSPKPKVSDCCQNLRPTPATQKIFAPKTAEMTSEFLKSSDDDPCSTSITDELDDLTHLAPTAGDTCVPLGTPLLNDVLHNILSNNDEITNPLLDHGKDISLFTAYRDDCSNSSPSLTQSPGSCTGTIGYLGDDNSTFEDSAIRLLGFETSEEDMPFKQYEDPLGGEDLPLLLPPEIQWDFAAVNSENSSQGSLSSMDMKTEDNISDFEQLLQGHDALITDQVHSKLNLDSDHRKRGSPPGLGIVKKRKHQTVQDPGGGGSSVLMNLLVAGRDVNAGYDICIDPRKNSGKTGS
uniref:Hypoxia-inducible factor 1-alpha n=2 Tax=Lygus hesperus TaxID=30085 RepID=A0A0A9WWP6_LYGHE